METSAGTAFNFPHGVPIGERHPPPFRRARSQTGTLTCSILTPGTAITRGLPVILLTAKAQGADLRYFEKLGVAGVLTKPFNLMSLPEQVADVLAGAGAAETSAPAEQADNAQLP